MLEYDVDVVCHVCLQIHYWELAWAHEAMQTMLQSLRRHTVYRGQNCKLDSHIFTSLSSSTCVTALFQLETPQLDDERGLSFQLLSTCSYHCHGLLVRMRKKETKSVGLGRKVSRKDMKGTSQIPFNAEKSWMLTFCIDCRGSSMLLQFCLTFSSGFFDVLRAWSNHPSLLLALCPHCVTWLSRAGGGWTALKVCEDICSDREPSWSLPEETVGQSTFCLTSLRSWANWKEVQPGDPKALFCSREELSWRGPSFLGRTHPTLDRANHSWS